MLTTLRVSYVAFVRLTYVEYPPYPLHVRYVKFYLRGAGYYPVAYVRCLT